MAVRLIGVNDADPVLPAGVVAASASSIRALLPMVDVRDDAYGAACDGVTDDTAAWNAAIAAVGATGGTITWKGSSRITSRLVIDSDNISIIGWGGGLGATPTVHGSMLLLDHASAGITLAAPSGSGGLYSNFTLWNNGHALSSMFKIEVVACAELSHVNFEGANAAAVGLQLWGAQNCTFNCVQINRCATNIDFNNSTFNNMFTRIDSEFASEWHVRMTDEIGTYGGGYGPSYNTFERCIFEHGATGTDDHQGILWASSGIDNVFRDCLIIAGDAADALIKIDATSTYHAGGVRLTFDSVVIQGAQASTTAIKQATGTTLNFYGQNALTGHLVGWEHNGGTAWMQFPFREAGITTMYTGTAVASLWANVVSPFGRPLVGTMEDADSYVFRYKRRSDAFYRFNITNLGAIEMGDGTANADTVLIRFSPNLMQMAGGDSFLVDGVFNAGLFRLGATRMWRDATGRVRTLSGAPGSDTAGALLQGVSATAVASASSITTDSNTTSHHAVTALAANLTINAPTGTPADGQALTYRLKDNATSRTLTWNAAFVPIGVTLPSATVISKWVYVVCEWNASATAWHVIDVKQQA